MALEVARAYDENKNLVPLYILTDGDPVYDPVTPGFIVTSGNENTTDNIEIYINNNAMNPTGGDMGSVDFDLNFLRANTNPVVVLINNSNFKITVQFYMYMRGGSGTSSNPAYSFESKTYAETIDKKSSKSVTISDISSRESENPSTTNLMSFIIQRVL